MPIASVFFFSSRRRHTRFDCDWSSDVCSSDLVEHVNQLGPKRAQGLSTGDYIRLAAINRACEPVSKQAMWDWVSGTSLPRVWPEASAAQLTSQHFRSEERRVGKECRSRWSPYH